MDEELVEVTFKPKWRKPKRRAYEHYFGVGDLPKYSSYVTGSGRWARSPGTEVQKKDEPSRWALINYIRSKYRK